MTDSRLQRLSWPLVMVASESLRAAFNRHVRSNRKDYTLPTDSARKNRSQLPKKRPAVRSEPNASRSPANRPRAHGVHVPSRAPATYRWRHGVTFTQRVPTGRGAARGRMTWISLTLSTPDWPSRSTARSLTPSDTRHATLTSAAVNPRLLALSLARTRAATVSAGSFRQRWVIASANCALRQRSRARLPAEHLGIADLAEVMYTSAAVRNHR